MLLQKVTSVPVASWLLVSIFMYKFRLVMKTKCNFNCKLVVIEIAATLSDYAILNISDI